MATDIRIDEIIAKNQAFAQPILKHLRKLVHTACPDVEEKVKWGDLLMGIDNNEIQLNND
jgi:hypothetical protein